MRIFTSIFKQLCFFILLFALPATTRAQKDSTFLKRTPADTSGQKLNMDAVYDRPFLQTGKLPLAIGGYMEANTQYAVTDGVTDGFSFQFRRTNLFFSSTIGQRIKFFSELEFEDGTKEINLEAAFMDIGFHPLLNLRGGIVVLPIGAFNQNHDSPRWDIIDRPIASTSILPATLSNAGFGMLGKHFVNNWIFGYEAYLTNGFDDSIIDNEEGRTSLAAGKKGLEKFEESNSGLPMFTGKIAVKNRKIGEAGISFMHGVYNKWREDGLTLDDKRSVSALVFDFNTALLKNRLTLTGEAAKVWVDIPGTYSQNYGNEQFGGFIDITGTIVQRPVLGWEKAKINLVLRLEYADYNQEKFNETGGSIGDEVWSVVSGLAFRPVGTTVLRFNYRHLRHKDFLNNPAAKTGIIQFGLATYF